MIRHFNGIFSKLCIVKLRFINNFTGCEIIYNCMDSIPTHCLFKSWFLQLAKQDTYLEGIEGVSSTVKSKADHVQERFKLLKILN